MLPIAILTFGTELLKLLNTFLEGVPVEQRQAQSIQWFVMWWPVNKGMLELMGASEKSIAHVEGLVLGKINSIGTQPPTKT